MDNAPENGSGNGKPQSSRKFIKILIPVLIVIAIAGIYLFKNPSATAQNSEDYSAAEFDLDATEDFDLDKILSYGLPAVIDFGSDSCIPCQEMAPVLKELNAELRGKAIIKFVDVWKNSDPAQKFPLRVIPTQFFFGSDGKPYVPKDENGSFILYKMKETGAHAFTAHEGGMDKQAILDVLKELGVE